jgi:hypothetical protein
MNEFLLDRLSSEVPGQCSENKQALVNLAQEMLDIVILFEGLHNPAGGLLLGSTRLPVYFGIPSAGVLAIELLKQYQYPKRYSIRMTRSKVIRNLSVFTHFLANVTTDHGNYLLCSRINKVISKILDQVLEDPPRTVVEEMVQTHDTMQLTPIETDGSQSTPLQVDMPAVMGPMDDMDFMHWISAVDWNKGPWTDAL